MITNINCEYTFMFKFTEEGHFSKNPKLPTTFEISIATSKILRENLILSAVIEFLALLSL
jgi:hypothetical protein